MRPTQGESFDQQSVLTGKFGRLFTRRVGLDHAILSTHMACIVFSVAKTTSRKGGVGKWENEKRAMTSVVFSFLFGLQNLTVGRLSAFTRVFGRQCGRAFGCICASLLPRRGRHQLWTLDWLCSGY